MTSTIRQWQTGEGENLNNLNSLRLILSSLVVLAHSNNLFHVAQGTDFRFSFFLLNMSDVAVSAFFMISGMLTYASFERDPDVRRFYSRRFFRVFPAYWTLVVVQTLVFMTVFSVPDWQDLFKYLAANLLTANFLMPSFVDGIPAFNGSLWTIKIEAAYYVLLPFLFPLLMSRTWFPILLIVSFIWAVGIPHEELARQLPGKLFLFGIGIVIARTPHAMRGEFALPALIGLPACLLIYFQVKGIPIINELVGMLLSVCIVLIFLRRWVRWEPLDISYTLYLAHYPIMVLVTRHFSPGVPYWQMLLLSAAVTLVAALALSLAVERPALKVGRKVVRRFKKQNLVEG